MGKIDGIPSQGDKLSRPQTVPVGYQDHGGVAMAVAVLPRDADQAVDLVIGEILAGADLGVGTPARGVASDCPINGWWRYQRQMWFCHGFSGLSMGYCPKYDPLRDSAQGQKMPIRRAQTQFEHGYQFGTSANFGATELGLKRGFFPKGGYRFLRWQAQN